MRTFPVKEIDGVTFTFGLDSAYITIRQIVKLLREVPEVSNVRPRKRFSSNSDVHVRFEFKGTPFIVLEPFGDNSEYWVGPEDIDRASEDVSSLKQAFDDHRLSPFQKLFGDLVTFQFLRK